MTKIKVLLNEDKELVKHIREQIKKNNGHCCCAIQFNDDNICMCKDFKEQIKNEKLGYCHCYLYKITE